MVKKRILVVEDEGIVAKDIQSRLNDLGYDVPEIAATGNSALEKFEAMNPDLVLMDIMLKGEMNGIEVAAEMRKLANKPIIYLTAYSDNSTLEQAKVTEPYGYILKPFDERELHTTIEMAFYKHKMEKKLREREAWLKTILSSIGDGVIATDHNCKVTYLNPVAEQLTGWKHEDALNKDFDVVFKIIDEKTGDPSKNSLTTVLREGVVIGMGNHALLISKDGQRRPIEDSAAPIRDESGTIVGVVSVFKDIADRRRSEQNLRDNEERFRLVAETATDGIITIDTNSTITFVNRATEKIFGYSAQDLVGESLSKIIPKPLREQHGRSFQRYLNSDKKSISWMGIELTGLHKSGNEFPFEISFGEYFRGGQRLFTGFIRDITERKLAEEQIKILAKFPADTPNPLLRVGVDKTILYANLACMPLLNALDCEVNQSIPDLLKPPVNEVLKTNKSTNFRIEIDEKYFSFLVAPFSDINCVYLYGRDITLQKRAEDELAAQKERLATTLRSIGDGVITTDTDGKIVLLNKMAERLTGWAQEEAVGKQLQTVFNIVNEKTKTKCEDPVLRVLKTGDIIELSNHTQLIAKNGSECLIADSAAPIRDKDSKIIGVVLVFQDITDRTILEAEASKAQKLESLGVLAGGIAHDFNNILTGILGNVSLIKLSADKEDPLYKRMVEAEKAALRAKDLTQQLLTFARGGAPIRIAASVDALVMDSANFALTGSNVKCDYVGPPDKIWKVEIDPGQVSQVINNLIINADQAMPDGGTIKIEIKNFDNSLVALKSLKQVNYVRISVRDEGVGIHPEHLGKIFDPYFTTKQKGSGLGLAICYSIIRNHDGIITVESEVGSGTSFHIYLPATSKKLEPKLHDYDFTPTQGKGRILVMDDEEIIRDVMSEMLPKLGYDLQVVKDGKEAISAYIKAQQLGMPYDGVILDLTIPGGMGGKESVRKILEINPDARVIVASGYSNDPIMANHQEYGFFDRIVKPFQIQDVAGVLSKTIS